MAVVWLSKNCEGRRVCPIMFATYQLRVAGSLMATWRSQGRVKVRGFGGREAEPFWRVSHGVCVCACMTGAPSPLSLLASPWPAIAQTLKKRYLNKVVPDLGLAVAFGGFISCEDSVIRTRAASGSVRVRFSLVLFAPKQGHVLKGWVAEVSPTRGVKISMMFFDNIWVPLEHCPPDIVFENRPNTNELGLHTPDSLCPNTEPGVKQWWIYMFDYVLSVVKVPLDNNFFQRFSLY